MGWATAHFQFWVATLQVVLRQERRGVRYMRACAHDRDDPPCVTTEVSVAIGSWGNECFVS